MHASVRSWVEQKVRQYALTGHAVLEVGSYDENGGVRDLFDPGHYLGVDLHDGPGVDMVLHSERLPTARFGAAWPVIVCLEVLEHAEHPCKLVAEMADVACPGAVLLLTTRGPGFPYHGKPDRGYEDYWRFTAPGLRLLLEPSWRVDELAADTQENHPGWMVAAVRR